MKTKISLLLSVSIAASIAATLVVLPATQAAAQALGFQVDYAENGIAPVRTFTATDDEGTVVVWFLSGIDSGNLSIDNGVIRFLRSPNYEDPKDADRDNVYMVTIEVSEGANTTSADLQITVINVDEQGTVDLSSIQPEIETPITAALADPDGSTIGVSWQWERSSSGQTGWNTISGAITATYTPGADDADSYLRATVSYSDGEGASKHAYAVSDNVVQEQHDYGNAPTFPTTETGLRSVAENTVPETAIGAPVTAVDDESKHTLTYSLGGADAKAFGVNRFSGQLLTKAPLDYEAKNSYSVIVRATDPSNASDVIGVTITVSNIDEPATIAFLSAVPIVGTALRASLADPDGDVIDTTWLWERSDGGLTDWTAISVASGSSYTPTPDDEGSYLRATVSYSDGEGSGKSVQTTSANPVEAPVDHKPVFHRSETGIRNVAENTPPGTAIGVPFTATDEEGHRLTYFLLDTPDAALFDLDPSTGQLRTKAPLDFETKSLHSVVVGVSDSEDENRQPNISIVVTIIVTDVEEADTGTSGVTIVADGQTTPASARFFSGPITGQDFCINHSLGGPRSYPRDRDGDGIADVCLLPTTLRAAVARQDALETLAAQHPEDFYNALFGMVDDPDTDTDESTVGTCFTAPTDLGDLSADLNADSCGPANAAARLVSAPPSMADDALSGEFFSGDITGPDFCADQSRGGQKTYPYDSDGNGIADTCSLPYTRREAVARQNALERAFLSHSQFPTVLAQACTALGNADFGDDPDDLTSDLCNPRTQSINQWNLNRGLRHGKEQARESGSSFSSNCWNYQSSASKGG